MNKIFEFIRPIMVTLLLIGLLQLTGLWGNVSATAQMVVLKTGLLNVDATTAKSPPNFDYNFSIKDLQGKFITFNQYQGKVVFINLWATWCGPCKAEMPGIQNLSSKLKGIPVEFVMLSLDKETAWPKVTSYIEKTQFTFPVFVPAGPLPIDLQVRSIPTTLVLNKQGKIIMNEVGTRNYDTQKMLRFLIDETTK